MQIAYFLQKEKNAKNKIIVHKTAKKSEMMIILMKTNLIESIDINMKL